LITVGDPAGIGPEVTLKALSVFRGRIPVSVIGDLALLRRTARKLKIPIRWNRFEWVDLGPQKNAGKAAYSYLQEAVRRIRAGQADALVTAPVSKEAIVRAGIPFIGHTEYLADQFHCKTTMAFVTGKFRVSLLTTHHAIKNISSRLSRAETVRVLNDTYQFIRRDLGVRKPRLALAGLNPHAGEQGMFGDEEQKILSPAVRAFKKAKGPFPVDILMKQAAAGQYDAVVAVYHDQALISVKLLGWEKAVNVTLGLPFVRTSPVHGTAFDIAGKGKANAGSMRSAIALAVQLAENRRRC
jgi:4-hydroxythreonine-4-phosphate dehydrogenase